jgi:hypothetical protein
MRSRFGSSLFLALMACGPSLDSPKNTKFDWSMIEHHPLKDDFENCLMVDGEAFRALHVSLSGAEPSISLFPGLMGAAPTNEFERARQEKGLKDAVSDLAKQHLEGSSCVEQRISVSQYDFDSNHFSLGSPQETVKVDVPLGIATYSERLIRAKIRFTNVEDEAFFPSKAKIKAEPAEAEAWLDQLGPGRSLNALILLKPEKGGHEEYHNKYWELLGHNRGVLVTTPLGKVVAVFSGEVPAEPGKASIAKADDDVDESMPTEPGKASIAKADDDVDESMPTEPGKASIAKADDDVDEATTTAPMSQKIDPLAAWVVEGGAASISLRTGISQQVETTLNRYLGQLKYCYHHRLRSHEPIISIEGSIEVKMLIANGRSEKTTVVTNTTGDTELAECLVKKVSRWRFPDDVDGEATLPVTFLHDGSTP